jgi:hypothetical protein
MRWEPPATRARTIERIYLATVQFTGSRGQGSRDRVSQGLIVASDGYSRSNLEPAGRSMPCSPVLGDGFAT